MRCIVIIICTVFLFASPLYAQEAYEEAAKMADEIHKKVATDVIYTEQETKALYYQNIQIIELLKEIRELLRQGLEEEQEEE